MSLVEARLDEVMGTPLINEIEVDDVGQLLLAEEADDEAVAMMMMMAPKSKKRRLASPGRRRGRAHVVKDEDEGGIVTDSSSCGDDQDSTAGGDGRGPFLSAVVATTKKKKRKGGGRAGGPQGKCKGAVSPSLSPPTAKRVRGGKKAAREPSLLIPDLTLSEEALIGGGDDDDDLISFPAAVLDEAVQHEEKAHLHGGGARRTDSTRPLWSSSSSSSHPVQSLPERPQYKCTICTEDYSMRTQHNPWWALVRHECPNCFQVQFPSINIAAPANRISYVAASDDASVADRSNHMDDDAAAAAAAALNNSNNNNNNNAPSSSSSSSSSFGDDEDDAFALRAMDDDDDDAPFAAAADFDVVVDKPPSFDDDGHDDGGQAATTTVVALEEEDINFAEWDDAPANHPDLVVEEAATTPAVRLVPVVSSKSLEDGATAPPMSAPLVRKTEDDDEPCVEAEVLSTEAVTWLFSNFNHARCCPGHHKSPNHANLCASTKFIMLHVRDCTAGHKCPFGWCASIRQAVATSNVADACANDDDDDDLLAEKVVHKDETDDDMMMMMMINKPPTDEAVAVPPAATSTEEPAAPLTVTEETTAEVVVAPADLKVVVVPNLERAESDLSSLTDAAPDPDTLDGDLDDMGAAAAAAAAAASLELLEGKGDDPFAGDGGDHAVSLEDAAQLCC